MDSEFVSATPHYSVFKKLKKILQNWGLSVNEPLLAGHMCTSVYVCCDRADAKKNEIHRLEPLQTLRTLI